MNRSQLRTLGTVAALLAAFLLGAFQAFPWDRLAETAFEQASRRAADAGARLDLGEVRNISRFPPAVEIRDVSLKTPLVSLQTPSVEVRLMPLAFLTRMTPVLAFKSQKAQVRLPGSSPLALGEIAAEADFSPSEARVVSIQAGGDLGLSGKLSWSFEKRQISFADLSIRAPESLEPGLNLLRFSTGLRPEGNGQWRLRIP